MAAANQHTQRWVADESAAECAGCGSHFSFFARRVSQSVSGRRQPCHRRTPPAAAALFIDRPPSLARSLALSLSHSLLCVSSTPPLTAARPPVCRRASAAAVLSVPVRPSVCLSVRACCGSQHHCRVCGDVFCSRCTQHRVKLHRRDESAVSRQRTAAVHANPSSIGRAPSVSSPVPRCVTHRCHPCARPVSAQHRVCESCHRTLRSQAASTAASPLALSPLAAAASAAPFPPQLLYRSQSLCARCSFVDRSGFTLQPSVVLACLPAELPGLTPTRVRSLPASLHRYAPSAAAQPAEVGAASSASVYLGVCCSVHPNEPFVLLSSSFPFFVRTLTFDHPPASPPVPSASSAQSRQSALAAIVERGGGGGGGGGDIEDLTAVASSWSVLPAPSSSSLPLLVELSVWRDGGGGSGWMSDAELDGELQRFHELFPPSHTFVIKVNGGLLERKSDVLTLNQKLHHVLTLSSASAAPAAAARPAAVGWKERVSTCPLVVDLTFDRLIDLALLDDSALLKANVLPCVRYFLSSSAEPEEAGQQKGVASVFISQMSSLLNALRTITDMSLLLLLTVDEPGPPAAELQAILDFIQAQHSIIRMLVLTRERSPSVILRQLLSPASTNTTPASSSSLPSQLSPVSASAAFPSPSPQSTDPYALLSSLESASHGRIHPFDFIPLRAFTLLSPVLSMFGFRQFGLTASPFCLLATVLVNTPTLRSIPLSHLVDLHRLYHALLPIADSLAAASSAAGSSGRPSVSLSDLKRVQRSLKSCMIARLDVPDLLSYVSGRHEESSAKLRAVLRSMQVVVLHNKMDVASVDMQRRCECLVMQPSPVQKGIYVAQCTGCI